MAQLVTSTVVQAVSFVGAQYLLSLFNHKDYEKERLRHDKAIEELTKAKNEFYEEEVKRRDRIEELERETQKANKDFDKTNKLFEELGQLKSQSATEPTLGKFYKPSDEMKHRQTVAIGVVGVAARPGLVGVVGMLLF